MFQFLILEADPELAETISAENHKAEDNGQKAFWNNLRLETPFQYQETLRQESVQRWIDKLWNRRVDSGGIDSRTAIASLRYVHEFSKYLNKDCDEIIKDARQSKLPSTTNQYKWEEVIENYEKLLFTKHKRSTGIEKLNAIKSFFSHNRVELDYDAPLRAKGGKPNVPDKQFLRKLFVLADLQMRSWILVQSQSGLSEIDIFKVDVDSCNNDPGVGEVYPSFRSQIDARSQNNSNDAVYVTLPRQKTGITAETFLGPEAVSMIRLRESSRRLFPDWKGEKDPASTVRKRFVQMHRETDVQITAHMLRRYFETTLQFAGVNELIINVFMGHSSKKMGAFYTGPTIAQLREKYLEVYPKLRLFPELDPRQLWGLTPKMIGVY